MSPIENEIRTVALGSFDGVHVAHRELIDLVECVVVIEHSRGSLTPGYKRSWYCDKPCAFYLLESIRWMSAQEFVARLRLDYPRLEKIVVGYDFRFGYGKEGTAKLLEDLFEGEVVVVGEITLEGISVHAGVIRDLLKQGEIEQANRLLGRAYRIDGEAIRGQGIGSRELVPTINLRVEDYQLPKEGVYATKTQLGEQWYESVSFLGERRTTQGGFAVETHLLSEAPEKIEGRVFLEFHQFLRENRRFDRLSALKEQIYQDIDHARDFWRRS